MPLSGTITADAAAVHSDSLVIPVVDPTAPAGQRNKKLPITELASADALTVVSDALDDEVAARIAGDAALTAALGETNDVLGATLDIVAALDLLDAVDFADAITNLVAFDVASSAALAAVVDDVLAADAALQSQIDILAGDVLGFADLIEDAVSVVAADLAVLEGALDGGATGAVLTKASGTNYDFVWTAKTYQLKVAVGGVPDDDQWFGGDAVAVALTLPANFAGSYAHARTAATAEYVITVKNGATTIGTITFAAAGVTGTFATSGGTAKSAVAGDKLTLVGPASADATIADIYLTIVGTYV